MIELANGCICCTVADDFLPAMRTILARDPAPDHIVIETSGLALPKPLVRAFDWPEVRNRVTVDGVLVVADAAAVLAGRFAADPDAVQAAARGRPGARPRDSPLEELFEEQLGCADLVLVNKADRVADADRAAVEARSAPSCGPACGWSGPATAGSIPPWRWAWASAPRTTSPAAPRTTTTARSMGTTISRASSLELPPVADPETAGEAACAPPPRPRHPAGQGLPRGRRQADAARGAGAWASASSATTTGPGGPDEAPAGELVVIGLRGLEHEAIRAVMTGTAAA